MKMRIVLLLTFSLFLVMCGSGRRPTNGNDWSNGTQYGNGQDGQIVDTTTLEGNVKAFSEQQQFVVIGTMLGLASDTVYYNDRTVFPQGMRNQVLRQGADVRARYVEIGGRKLAVRIEPMGNNGK